MSLDIIYIRKCIIQIQNIQIENTFWDYPTFKGHNVKAIVRNEAKLKEGLEKDHDIKDHENLNIIKVIMAISVLEFQVGGGDTKSTDFLLCKDEHVPWRILYLFLIQWWEDFKDQIIGDFNSKFYSS